MADLVELDFRPEVITARYRDAPAQQVDGVSAAVRMLAALANETLPISVDSEDARELAQRTASLAGMTITERDGQLFLLRPGAAPEPLIPPIGAPTRSSLRPAASAPLVLITISPGNLFSHAEPAYQELIRNLGTKRLPSRYHNYCTGTFLAGGPVGQINSLYRDLRNYGYEAIEPKIRQWAEHVRTRADPDYRKIVAWFDSKVQPHDIRALKENHWVMLYFKAWAMLRLVRERSATSR